MTASGNFSIAAIFTGLLWATASDSQTSFNWTFKLLILNEFFHAINIIGMLYDHELMRINDPQNFKNINHSCCFQDFDFIVPQSNF